MKNKTILTACLAAALISGIASADDFDFDFSSDDFSFGDFTADSGSFGSGDSVDVSGSVATDARAYISGDVEACDLPVAGGVAATVDLSYSGTDADAEIKLNLDSRTIEENPAAMIDEAYVTGWLDNLKLDVGLMKNVWGKGDKLHVIDNFNADDYTDFIIPDYLDRRISTLMLKGSYAFDYADDVLSNIKLEGVYTPFLPVDRFAESGEWTPAQVTALRSLVTEKAEAELAGIIQNLEEARLLASESQTLNALYAAGDTSAATVLTSRINAALADGKISVDSAAVTAYAMTHNTDATTATKAVAAAAYAAYVEENLKAANTSYALALNNASLLSGNTDLIYPDTNLLKYGQAGARLTASLGNLDLGLSYYYGHYKQPSVNMAKIESCIDSYLSTGTIGEEDKFLAYDRKQTFGLEAATILWHFNVRGEACFNLTDDVEGTDPWVHNNSIQWLGGFDIDLPLWNMNLNIQETGTYVLGNDKISGSATETCDVDYNKNGYSNNRLVANVTASFKNEQVLPEVTVMYGIESGDLVVMPKLTVKPTSELSLTASGMYIWTRDQYSQFAAWKDNSFLQIGAVLNF